MVRRWITGTTLPILLVATLAGLLGACAEQLTPQDVADRFWRAVVTRHPGKIQRYVVQADRKLLDGEAELLPIAHYKLGRVVIDGEAASIETRVTLDGDTPVPLQIETRLVRENDRWRVNYQATVDEISANSKLAQVIGQISALGETLKDGLEQSVDDMNRALPAIEAEISRIESQIKQHMPELRRKLELFSEQIKDALKAPPRDPQPPAAVDPEDTIAL